MIVEEVHNKSLNVSIQVAQSVQFHCSVCSQLQLLGGEWGSKGHSVCLLHSQSVEVRCDSEVQSNINIKYYCEHLSICLNILFLLDNIIYHWNNGCFRYTLSGYSRRIGL